VLTYGFQPDAQVRPEGLEIGTGGSSFTVGGLSITSHLLGRFNVENALAAVASARLLGIEDAAIASGIASVKGIPGRFEAVDEGQPFSVVVDYAHTPDSLANALRTAADLAAGRVICVFGCGGDRDRSKRAPMGEAASSADVVIVTSDNPRSEDPAAIATEILAGAGGSVTVELDRRAAIEQAVALAEAGDLVLVAGKGHEQGQEVDGRVLAFDDRAVVREALRRQRARA
jgi:UDP-N-acetylmuramoyl-L-alanyl-D-glutamate--2,6-diaminopimelate ligase